MPSRRNFLRLASGAVLIPLINIERSQANELTPLSESNSQAQALQYVKVSEKQGQLCANCLHFVKETMGCNIFPGKSVEPAGWCAVWVAR